MLYAHGSGVNRFLRGFAKIFRKFHYALLVKDFGGGATSEDVLLLILLLDSVT
jgi:Mg2+/Co2+ transporter CorC